MSHEIITCPKCKTAQPTSETCQRCGIIFAKYRPSSRTTPSPKTIDTLSPDMLNLPRPKPHSPYHQGKLILIAAVVWMLVWGGAMLGFGAKHVNDTNTYNRLRNDGVVASATVTRSVEKDSGDSTAYLVFYRFSVENMSVDGQDDVSYELYRRLQTGATLDVLYLTSQPQISAVKTELAPPGNTGFVVFFMVMSVSAFLLGAGLAWFGVLSMKRAADLRTKGRVVWGVVFDKWEQPGSESDFYYVAYAYKVPEDATQIFSGAIQSEKAYKALNQGDRIAIRYLPEKPQLSSPDGKAW